MTIPIARLIFILLALSFLFAQCQSKERKTLEVTATAYNSLPEQTSNVGGGVLTAWGDTLRKGMKCIAVSRDLIDSGLTHNTKVWIEGVDGTYVVNDKMNKRWTKKIDIYMGKNEDVAKEWGKRKVTISWVPKEDKSEN